MKPFLLVLLVTATAVHAQNRGDISGTIHNNGGQPLEAATVLLRKAADSAVIKSAITDKAGTFVFHHPPAGTYFCSASCVGYANGATPSITVGSEAVTAPAIILSPSAQTIKAATVTAQKRFVEWKLDKMIVNVDASPFYTPGQSALDVLERSPGVEVDRMGATIGLIGRPGTAIYINGRLSYLSGQDLFNYLKGLPAGSIDQIEIMAQPSARFDASGDGGAINIVLKKNQADGLYGSVTLSPSLGFYVRNRDNLLLNWRSGKVNLNFTGGISDERIPSRQQINAAFRPAYEQPAFQYQEYSNATLTHSTAYTPQLALDYQASKQTALGIRLTGQSSRSRSTTDGPVQLFDSAHQLFQQEGTRTTSSNPVTNFGGNLNLLHQWARTGTELSADADYLHYHSPATQLSDNYPESGAPYLLNGSLPSNIDIYAVKTDYSHPFRWGQTDSTGAANAKFEAGLKLSHVRTDNNSSYTLFDSSTKSWTPDAPLNNHFIYSEQINAAYLNLSRQFSKKWSAEAGLRAEQTIADGNEQIQNSSFHRNYTKLFPSVFLGYTPNDIHSFTLSFRLGMTRPSYTQLNPFRYIINQYNIREGNPGLQAYVSDLLQAVYTYKGTFTVFLLYFRANNVFARVFNPSGAGNDVVTIQTVENVALRRNVFLGLAYNKSLTKWWTTSINVTLIDARLIDHANLGGPEDNLISAKLNTNNQLHLGHGLNWNLRGYYGFKWMEGIRVYGTPSGYFSTGLDKKLWKDKATLSVELADPLKLYHPGQTSESATSFIRTYNYPESRFLTLTFNYRFGKKKQDKRKDDGSAQEEQRRVDF